MSNPLSEYFSFHAFRYGNVLIQLMQMYVQKSYSTTLSFIAALRSSGVVLTYPDIPTRSGAIGYWLSSTCVTEFVLVVPPDACLLLFVLCGVSFGLSSVVK